jgi:hypothetical protein
MRAAFLLRKLARADVDHHSAQMRDAIPLHHHRDEVSHPDRASIGGDHPVFEIVVALVGDRALAEAHRPLPVVGVDMIGPERRFGQPAFDRIAEDALGLLADEGELEAGHLRFPHDPVDGVHQVAVALLRGGGISIEALTLRRRGCDLGVARVHGPHHMHPCFRERLPNPSHVARNPWREKSGRAVRQLKLPPGPRSGTSPSPRRPP